MKKILTKKILFIAILAISALTSSCIKDDLAKVDFNIQEPGLLVLSEGSMGIANSSLYFYNPVEKAAVNDLFYRANQVPIGDVAQSIYKSGNSLFIMVTNSSKIIQINKATFKQEKVIAPAEVVEPRYMVKSNNKFYVSNYKNNNILVFDSNMKLDKVIKTTIEQDNTNKQHSPNFIIEAKGKLFAACDFQDKTILAINTQTDTIDHAIEVGITPSSMVVDKNDNLWVLTTGGYDGHPLGKEAPSLYKINVDTYAIEKKLQLDNIEWASNLRINTARDTLYFIDGGNKKVKQLPITAASVSDIKDFIVAIEAQSLYGLYVDQDNVYVTDAKDYISNGALLRYNKEGQKIDSIKVGINPSFIIEN